MDHALCMTSRGDIMKLELRDITKLPNLLTVARILLIPVFVIVFLWEDGMMKSADESDVSGYVLAAVIVLISGITDALDGFIARRFNMITDLGKALDPFADKLTQAAVVVCLIVRYRSIWWLLVTLFLMIVIKEVTMLVVGLLFLKKGQDLGGAKWFGKAATIVFYLMVLVLIGAPSMPIVAAIIMISVMICFTIATFVLYMREYFRLYKQRGEDDGEG